MKSTESIDETAASTGRSLADGEAVSPSQTSLMDQRRRRLVRGAIAAAPLVLTLRSGALAAASCTGTKIKIADASTDSNGKIKNAGSDATGLLDFVNNPSQTDYCFKSVDKCSDPTAALEGKISTSDGNDLSVPVYKAANGKFYCGGTPGGSPTVDAAYKSQARNGNFAILSSASHTSLIAGG